MKYLELTCPSNIGFSWLEHDNVCERDNAFAFTHSISGLSSPFDTYYDSDNNLLYCISSDYSGSTTGGKGNIFWFNPLTATTEAHMTYYTGITFHNIYGGFFDHQFKRVYLYGTDVQNGTVSNRMSGLTVFDITGRTHYQVGYGDNEQYQRIYGILGENEILGSYYPGNKMVRFNRNDPTIKTEISLIGKTDYFMKGAQFTGVGDKIWVYAGSGNDAGGVGIFDNQLNFINSIATGSINNTDFLNSDYWGTGYYDADYKKFYNNDFGSRKLRIIDVNNQFSGGTISSTVLLNKYKALVSGDNSYPLLTYTLDKISNKLYVLMQCAYKVGKGSGDLNINRIYEVERSTGNFKKMFKDKALSGLRQVTDAYGVNSLVGVKSGYRYWDYINTNYEKDGTMTFINNSVSGDTNGNVIVTKIQKFDITNGLPLSEVKDNLIGDPDYILPYTSTTVCSPTTSLTCPDIIVTQDSNNFYFELDVVSSVKFNPVISGITVSAMTISNTLIGTPKKITIPFPNNYNYYMGSFSGVTNGHHIQTQYYNFSGGTLGTICT